MSLEMSAIASMQSPETVLTFQEKCAIATCRSCGKERLSPVLDLGEMPLADALLTAPSNPESLQPLEVAFCRGCGLVQILHTVPPQQLFGADYPCFSSCSETVVKHAARSAEQMIRALALSGSSLVIEPASNDGCMLRHFVEAGIPVLGVEPAPGPARASEEAGVPTLREFFTRELGERLASEGKKADLVIANHVLAMAPDPNDFVAGIAAVLKDTGMAVIEVPYVRDLIEKGEFDTIDHERPCYFSVNSARALFRRHGLSLNRVERIAIHGGSIRLFVEPRERVENSVKEAVAAEIRDGLTEPAYYAQFGARVRKILGELRVLIRSIKESGETSGRIAAYGAGASGTILLNAFGIGDETIEFVADRSPHKQGKYMPGAHIPIVPAEELLERMPDYTLLLEWEYKDEILAQQAEYRRRGGKFIIPIPTPRVV